MEDNQHSSPVERGQPIALIAQLMQRIPTLRDADEALQCMADAMVHQLDLLSVQLYMLQKDTTGQTQARLRTSACSDFLDPTLLSSPWLTIRITQTVSRLIQQRQSASSLPIERLFSSPQTTLLNQHRIRFWSGYFLSNSMLFPAATTSPSPANTRIPLTMVVSLFTSQSLSTNLARSVSFVTDQSLRVMHNSSLLSSPNTQPTAAQSSFSRIIPRRIQQIDQFQAANPFASAPIISDKHARQLYTSIDGRKNLSEIARMLPFDQQTFIQHLHYLYTQKYIQFYTPQGTLVEPSSLFPKIEY